jgi:hypothetical protein
MNCQQCQEQLAEYVEDLLESQQRQEIALHLRDCPVCRAEAAEHQQLRDRLIRDAAAAPKTPLEPAVMRRIHEHQAPRLRRITMPKRYGRVGLGLAAAAAIAVLLVVPWGGGNNGRAMAAEVFAKAVKAISDLQSVYIKLSVRTIAHDNFEYIEPDHDFVPHEMWKEFGPRSKYRVEKPGRVVTSDGESSLLVFGGGDRQRTASKGSPNTNFVGWIKTFLDVDQVFDSELRCAEQNDWDVRITEETGPDGRLQQVVTIEAEAEGDFTHDWLKNKSISNSDQQRVFRFDAQTGRLEDLELWLHADEEDVLVLDIEEIIYNPAIEPDLFAIEPPETAIWYVPPVVLPDNEKYAALSPDEAARAFFQALADENWEEVLKFHPFSAVSQNIKDTFGGLEILEIGEPFQSGRYRGWFVPYKIRLNYADAVPYVKKYNLALRNDNAAGRYVVDGGF